MKKVLLAGLALVSVLSNAHASSEPVSLDESFLAQQQLSRITNVKLVDLLKLKREIYIQVNQDINPGPEYDSVSKRTSLGGLLASDKYDLTTTFRFMRTRPYGEKDNGTPAYAAIKKGTLMKITQVDDNAGRYSEVSLLSISAEGNRVRLAKDFASLATVFVQIHGSRKNSTSKLTVGDLEKSFKNAFTFYAK